MITTCANVHKRRIKTGQLLDLNQRAVAWQELNPAQQNAAQSDGEKTSPNEITFKKMSLRTLTSI